MENITFFIHVFVDTEHFLQDDWQYQKKDSVKIHKTSNYNQYVKLYSNWTGSKTSVASAAL